MVHYGTPFFVYGIHWYANVIDPQTRTAGERGRPEPVLPRLPMPSNRLNGCRACVCVRVLFVCWSASPALAPACFSVERVVHATRSDITSSGL